MAVLHTSIALRRADCSQACPSASAQNRALDKAYSRRLERTSSSISKAAKLAVNFVRQDIMPQLNRLTRVDNSLFGESLNWGSLVTGGIDELVVDNLDGSIVRWEERDLVGNRLSVCKRRDILPNTSKAQLDVFGARSRQLRLALLAQNNDIGVWLLNKHFADTLCQAGVDTTTEALVRAGNNDQCLLVISLQWLRLGLLEYGIGCLAVLSRFMHRTLGPREFRGSHNLHGIRDLFDVTNRLESVLNLPERCESSTQIISILLLPEL
jgi:hypothetical protein